MEIKRTISASIRGYSNRVTRCFQFCNCVVLGCRERQWWQDYLVLFKTWKYWHQFKKTFLSDSTDFNSWEFTTDSHWESNNSSQQTCYGRFSEKIDESVWMSKSRWDHDDVMGDIARMIQRNKYILERKQSARCQFSSPTEKRLQAGQRLTSNLDRLARVELEINRARNILTRYSSRRNKCDSKMKRTSH